METEVRQRDWVLVVATEVYLTRARDEEEAGRGLGASWEYATIRQTLYEARGDDRKFIPIVFGREDAKFVPDALRSRTCYDVMNSDDRNRLINKVAGFPITVEPAPLGSVSQLQVVSSGMQPSTGRANIRPAHQLSAGSASIRPRLYLKVSTTNPGFMAMGGGPVTKLGTYKLKIEIWNKGKGAANKVRVAMQGITEIQKLGTIGPGDKPLTFLWELENQHAFREAPESPAVAVEYLDDDGSAYRQVGPLQAKTASGGFLYEGGNLEAPEAINEPTIAY